MVIRFPENSIEKLIFGEESLLKQRSVSIRKPG